MGNQNSVDIVSLANCVVTDPEGRQIKLAQLWQKQSVVLIFLRHFACIACRAHATQVWNDREKYEGAGAKIVFIGNGQATFIDGFKAELGLQKAMILTDPTLSSFRAAGFRHGFRALVQPKTLLNGVKLAMNGNKQMMPSAEAGTNWQLGGILVVKPDGRIAYHYISEALGDFPPESDIAELNEKTR
ncbi:MAG: AhpC/TSA family protein [Bdellovibrionota bacterium]